MGFGETVTTSLAITPGRLGYGNARPLFFPGTRQTSCTYRRALIFILLSIVHTRVHRQQAERHPYRTTLAIAPHGVLLTHRSCLHSL